MFCLIQYIPNPLTSTVSREMSNGPLCVLFSESLCAFYPFRASQASLATFQVLCSHVWAGAAVLGSVVLDTEEGEGSM